MTSEVPVDPRRLKDTAFGQVARIGKAVSSGPRIEILQLLCQGPRTVESIATEVALSVANTSRHLQVLRTSRLVDASQRGTHRVYRVADPSVARFVVALRELGEGRLLELQEAARGFVADAASTEPLDRESLRARVLAGEVTLIDVRPQSEFEAGHIAGAISIPIEELKQRLEELPRDREVVAYCRGPYCLWAATAVRQLAAAGFTATRMEDGVAEFAAAGQGDAVEEVAR